ncbi:hypothetical protein DFO53_3536 [Enterobacter sp. AG5470]|nr:hypothetical protein DFO53_3536 [Enterobacter sp. AG5470]
MAKLTLQRAVVMAFTLVLAGQIAASQAENQRYISIRNTDSVWVPGNICALQFRLDNGGNGEAFNHLAITLRLKDKTGKTVSEGVMQVEPFGDSDATRSQNAFLESECQEDASQIEIVQATEEVNGQPMALPLTMFDPQFYQPLAIKVAK